MVCWKLNVYLLKNLLIKTVLMEDFSVLIRDWQDYLMLKSFRIVEFNSQRLDMLISAFI